jgi:dTDP-glucose pyrophosphorylase/CBS domain-containing protein
MTYRIHNTAPLLCPPTLTVAEVLARIEQASPNLFQVVVDAERRVLGTVTDGDLRRAILRGESLASPVAQCMRATPILGREGEIKANRILVQRAWFLPVVDAGGHLVELLVDRADDPVMSRALVMAGGFGKRLGPLTQSTPKPLLPVAGRPMLDRVLEQIEAAGVTKIDIAVHYLADQIKDFVTARRSAADVSLIEETEPLGTAGALALISDRLDEPVLVANGDVLTQVDLNALHRFHARHSYDGTIAVWRHEIEIPFGVIHQTPDGQFQSIEEKPRLSHFVAAGIYYLSPEFAALTPRGRPVDMPEVITNGAKAGLRIGLFPVHEYWKDVGRPGDFAAAQTDHQGLDGGAIAQGGGGRD